MASLQVTEFTKRPAPGTLGRSVRIRSNFFEITQLPRITVHHYDVTITPDVPPLVNRRVFAHMTLVYGQDRKSTRLNSSHVRISYAVFCLKKKRAVSTRRVCGRPRGAGGPRHRPHAGLPRPHRELRQARVGRDDRGGGVAALRGLLSEVLAAAGVRRRDAAAGDHDRRSRVRGREGGEVVYQHEDLSGRLPTLFFFNDAPPTEIYTLSLHDALPISRYGGEELAILLPQTNLIEAYQMADRLCDAVGKCHFQRRVTASIGVAACPQHGSSAETLVRSEEHTSELQSRPHLVCRLLLEKK